MGLESGRHELSAAEFARAIGGHVEGDPAVRISGIAGVYGAGPGDVTFAADEKHARAARQSPASAIILPDALALPAPCTAVLIRVPDLEAALERAAAVFAPPPPQRTEGVHPTAIVAPDAELGHDVSVGPCTVIESKARVGDHATLGPHVFIGRGAVIGSHAHLHAGVKVCHGCEVGHRVILHHGAVIGGDGFGYTLRDGAHRKTPQIGNVVIEDDVEIGCNTTVDRARFGSTRIGRGTKIDNLVMIAHNVQVGRHCIITAQCGIAGSTRLGDYVVLGAQAGLVDHIAVGDHAVIGAGSGVTKDVPPDTTVLGAPAEPRVQAARAIVALRRLPELAQAVRELRRKVNELCEATDVEAAPEND